MYEFYLNFIIPMCFQLFGGMWGYIFGGHTGCPFACYNMFKYLSKVYYHFTLHLRTWAQTQIIIEFPWGGLRTFFGSS